MINPIYRFGVYADSTNLLTPDLPDTKLGYLIVTGGFIASPIYNTSGKLTVKQLEHYIVTGPNTIIKFYNKNDKEVKHTNNGRVNNVNVPPTAKYMRVCNTKKVWNNIAIYKVQDAYPVYKDDLSKDYDLETNQQFFRVKLSGKLTFVRQDYDYIVAQPLETQFIVKLGISYDKGVTWDDEYYTGKFFKTDCEFRGSDKQCIVQPNTIDNYNDVLSGLEKEYNLIELKPKIDRLNYQKRPMIQIYIPGDDIVSNFLSGTYFEQQSDVVTNYSQLVNTYHFALSNLLKEINITGTSTPAVNALYIGNMQATGNSTFDGILYPSTPNGYVIHASQEVKALIWGVINYDIVRQSDNKVMFSYHLEGSNNPFDNAEFDMAAVQGSGASGSVHAEMSTYRIYARLLCDVNSIGNRITSPIPADDIVDNNRNYRRAIGIDLPTSYISDNYSTEPTEWGLADNGKYFAPPVTPRPQAFYPVARSNWRYASIWFAYSADLWRYESLGRKSYTLRDTYTIGACISVLLKTIAPEIKHEETPEYSHFLYDNENPISGNYFRLLISQKTNVLSGEYDTPAQKAMITLQQITNMLRDCFCCYWYIEDNKFKIEHILYFKNGGSYRYNPIYNVDLTQITNVRNGKSWDYNLDNWTYDKIEMPERYQFAWMDNSTLPFAGYPIEILSKYVTPGKIEEINVSNFTSDIDYMLLNPTDISNDGFALFAAIKDINNNYVLPFNTFNVNGIEYRLQNYIVSYMYLQPTFWTYDLPAYNVLINGLKEIVHGVQRKKKQQINYSSAADPDPKKMIKTTLGDGQINKISVTLCSRFNNITLVYDT